MKRFTVLLIVFYLSFCLGLGQEKPREEANQEQVEPKGGPRLEISLDDQESVWL